MPLAAIPMHSPGGAWTVPNLTISADGNVGRSRRPDFDTGGVPMRVSITGGCYQQIVCGYMPIVHYGKDPRTHYISVDSISMGFSCLQYNQLVRKDSSNLAIIQCC